MYPNHTENPPAPQCGGGFRYTLVNNKFDHDPKTPVELPWEVFAHRLQLLGSKLPPREHKDGPAVIFATFKSGGRITRDHVETVTALGLDIDEVNGDPKKALEDLHQALPYAKVAHSTFSSTPEEPRCRVILPFDREYTVTEFERIWRYVHVLTGGKLLDVKCKNPDRLYYTPRWPAGSRDRWVRVWDGPRLSISVIPANFPVPQANTGKSSAASARRKQGLHRAPTPKREAKELMAEILRHPLIEWMIEEPDAVDRETWRGVAQNIAAAVLDHSDLLEQAMREFHSLSEDYSSYSWSETERTFRDAVESARNLGPMTFQHMVASGMPEELWNKGATNLIHAARRALASRKGNGEVR